MSVPDEYTIEGRTVRMPVEVREAQNWLATFFVPVDPVRKLVAPTGLDVPKVGGFSVLALGFVRYVDTDLGAYDEFALSLTVRRHDAPPASARRMLVETVRPPIGVYIHRLPVNDGFSLAAGRGIWGYPKTLADFEMTREGTATRWTLRQDGSLALSVRFEPGKVPWMQRTTPPTYTFLDGTLRMTRWESRPAGVHSRFGGGATVTLGEGPLADELRSLGLPKRPLFSASIAKWRARFFAPEIVQAGTTSVSSEKESRASS